MRSKKDKTIIARNRVKGLFNLSGFILFLTISYVFCLPANAQEAEKVDSLKSVLVTQSLTDQYGTLVALAVQYADRDNKVSLGYIDQAYKAALVLNDTVKIVKSGRIKGQLLRRLDRLDEAMSIFNNLLPIARRNKLLNDHKVILNSLALAHSDRANYDKALELHFQSLLLREAEGNKAEISLTLGNIGFVYYKLNDYEKAIDYYNRSLKLKKESNDTYGIDYTLINIGYCYNELQLFDKAREYFKKGLKTCGDNCEDYVRINGEHGLGVSYYSLRKFEEAKEHFNFSYELSKKSDNKRFQAENLILLAKIAIKEAEYTQAVELLTVAEVLAQDAGYNRLLIDAYRQFSFLYKEQLNYERAAFYQDKYIHLKDSIFSEAMVKNLTSVQTKFEERENIKTIANREEELYRQRQFIIAVIIIAILASLLVVMLFRSNAAKRKANDRLDSEVKAATKDLEVANRLLGEVNRELDHFIYKTSHDIRGPLASLKGICNVALTDVSDPLALDYFGKLDFTAGRLDTLLRRLQKINQINHANLKHDPIDFESMLNDLEVLERRKGLPDRLTIKREIQPNINFSSDTEFIYLVLENLLDNAIKFHNSSELIKPFVLIRITADDQNMVISVIDNGIGIGQANPEELFQMFVRASERSASGGIGLYLSRRAMEKLGGEIHMRSTSEGFTEFYASFPLKAEVVL